jgi:serine protease inhibitor
MSILFTSGFSQGKTGINDIVSGNNAFAFDMYAKLGHAEGNIFFSPYSISTALAMTYGGARGNTEKQMAHALHFGQDQAAFHPAFGELQARINEIQKKGGVQLTAANSIWMQKEYAFLPAFLDLTKKNYDAALKYVDYKIAAEKARADINAWVENKTKEKIKDLIRPGALDAMTRMVLANAIYFKGSWAAKFDTQFTNNATFRVTEKDSVTVRMMRKSSQDFGYAENESVQCLELPYADHDLSMIVVLPKKKDLTAFEKTLSVNSMDSLNSRMRETRVEVFLPRFRTVQEFIVNDALSALGMTDALGGAADFSGMTGTKDLCVSDVIHKAFVDVNEEGTEAAAATAVAMRATAMREPPKTVVFRADHPFLFMIRENSTGSVLFMGRIVNPLK